MCSFRGRPSPNGNAQAPGALVDNRPLDALADTPCWDAEQSMEAVAVRQLLSEVGQSDADRPHLF
ncbi:MAG: hypothetical protein JXB30_07200 [Anaerolineae bacterium]|nr:hypothetical protein [Anaerolineae bacterium]